MLHIAPGIIVIIVIMIIIKTGEERRLRGRERHGVRGDGRAGSARKTRRVRSDGGVLLSYPVRSQNLANNAADPST